MTRHYNFSAGPAVLPEIVLQQAQAEMLEWRDSGMSVMEMSHRGAAFTDIATRAEADLRALLAIPDNYKVLFLQGGATQQFASIAFNLATADSATNFILTGSWGKKAIAEASLFTQATTVASSADTNFDRVPETTTGDFDPKAAFVHVTSNETIGGVEFNRLPDTGDIPLVADMSSNILSREIDVSRYGVIYAGAQKNIGPAGLTIVIVREDLLGRARSGTPSMLDYSVHADAASMSNTPPTYAWYIAGLVFRDLLDRGGLAAVEEINRRKAELLYNAIDNSDFYSNPVVVADRSRMNVPFILADSELDASFLKLAAEAGLVTLKGHRSVGGMRASIYNAMPESGVAALVEFMREFERTRA